MPILKLNHVSVFYKIYGEGEPLFLIGGLGLDHSMWASVITELSQFFCVVVMDNRCSGRSTVCQEPFDIADMAEDVYQLAVHLGIEQAYFCGNSMGGFILQALAKKHPDVIKKMVLSNTAMDIETNYVFLADARRQWFDIDMPVSVQRSLVQVSLGRAYSYRFLMQEGKLDEMIDLMLSHPHPISKEGYESQLDAARHFDSRYYVKDINVPTLVIAGSEDAIVQR